MSGVAVWSLLHRQGRQHAIAILARHPPAVALLAGKPVRSPAATGEPYTSPTEEAPVRPRGVLGGLWRQ